MHAEEAAAPTGVVALRYAIALRREVLSGISNPSLSTVSCFPGFLIPFISAASLCR